MDWGSMLLLTTILLSAFGFAQFACWLEEKGVSVYWTLGGLCVAAVIAVGILGK